MRHCRQRRPLVRQLTISPKIIVSTVTIGIPSPRVVISLWQDRRVVHVVVVTDALVSAQQQGEVALSLALDLGGRDRQPGKRLRDVHPDRCLAALSLLGRDEYYSVGCTGAVEGGRSRILQNLYRLDARGIKRGERVDAAGLRPGGRDDRHAIDDVEWRAVVHALQVKRAVTADKDLRATTTRRS